MGDNRIKIDDLAKELNTTPSQIEQLLRRSRLARMFKSVTPEQAEAVRTAFKEKHNSAENDTPDSENCAVTAKSTEADDTLAAAVTVETPLPETEQDASVSVGEQYDNIPEETESDSRETAVCQETAETVEQEPAEFQTDETEAVPTHFERLHSAYFNKCLELATGAVEQLPRRELDAETPNVGKPSDIFLFDIINGRFVGPAGISRSFAMPIYSVIGDSIYRRDSYGICKGDLVSSYSAFSEYHSKYLTSVIKNSIDDIPNAGNDTVDTTMPCCLMPDVVDEFNKEIRSQLNYKGKALFPIPRSIALAYTLQIRNGKVPDEFLCVDYDGEESYAIRIVVSETEDGERIFVRMGRKDLKELSITYRALAERYIRLYAEKNKLRISAQARESLIGSKAILQMLFEKNKPLVFDNGEKPAAISADEAVLAALREELITEVRHIQSVENLPVYPLCSLFCETDSNTEIYSIANLAAGCEEIVDRFKTGKPLWQEYLPKLELEVNRDGAFDTIELIGEKHREQRISASRLGDDVEIPVENGIISFPANGETEFYLPLIREVYGKHEKEKLARFVLQEPLQEETTVEITVKYKYGDVDSYKLIAVNTKLGLELHSEWCDAGKLENLAPHYSVDSEKEKHYVLSSEDREAVTEAFWAFDRSIHKTQRQYASSNYLMGQNAAMDQNARYYSKFFYSLNYGGWPFFRVQNYFKPQDMELASEQIAELGEKGVFDSIVGVLDGELPEGYQLGIDPQSNKDEREILLENAKDLACRFGVFFAESFGDACDTAVKEILGWFWHNGDLKDWLSITKYVELGENDTFGVWDAFSNIFSDKKTLGPNELRAMSNVCYMTEDWIYHFYHMKGGPEATRRVIGAILGWLKKSAWMKYETYNPRQLRDILELLLCICLLKSEAPSILDCNRKETKELVKRLKTIDKEMRQLKAEKRLKNEFNTRLGIETPPEYRNVNPVIYALIETLTGGDTVSLVGFTDDA